MAVARLKNFDPFTAKHLAHRLICLHGENEPLVRARAAALRESFAAAGDPPDIIDIDGDALSREPFLLADELGAISLFAERRVLRIQLGARGTREAFANALPRLPEAEGVLVIVEGGSDKRQDDTIGLLSADAACLVVACPPDAADDLADHARRVLAEAGVTLDAATSQDLVTLIDGDRSLLANELVKLLLLVETGGTVGLAQMRAAVADEAGSVLDEAAERILAGDLRATFETTDRIGTKGGAAVQLVGATLRKAFWAHRNASGTRAADLRRAIARLAEVIEADRSSDRLADARADLTLVRTAQFLRRKA